MKPAVELEAEDFRVIRDEIIERCAKIADELADDYGERNYSRLAAAIRALKDQP